MKGSIDIKVMRRRYLNNGIHQRVQQREDAFARVPSFNLERIYIKEIKAQGCRLKHLINMRRWR